MQPGCSTSQLVDKFYAYAKGLPADWRFDLALRFNVYGQR
jgi:hypothetical protein